MTTELPMTEELFREDATLLECEATVLAVDEAGVVLDRTVFYPLGGGQAGDAGRLELPDGHLRKHCLHCFGCRCRRRWRRAHA